MEYELELGISRSRGFNLDFEVLNSLLQAPHSLEAPL